MNYYETLAEVLLACRPVLKTVTPRKDLLALEAVWEGTLRSVAKAEEKAEPVFERMKANPTLWATEWRKHGAMAERFRWKGKRESQRQRWADLQWTVLVRERAVTEEEAVWAYLLDLRNILLDDRLQEPVHLDPDALEEVREKLDEDFDAEVELPVVGVLKHDWGCMNDVLCWKPLNQFSAADFHAIAEWYEWQVGDLFVDEHEYEDR